MTIRFGRRLGIAVLAVTLLAGGFTASYEAQAAFDAQQIADGDRENEFGRALVRHGDQDPTGGQFEIRVQDFDGEDNMSDSAFAENEWHSFSFDWNASTFQGTFNVFDPLNNLIGSESANFEDRFGGLRYGPETLYIGLRADDSDMEVHLRDFSINGQSTTFNASASTSFTGAAVPDHHKFWEVNDVGSWEFANISGEFLFLYGDEPVPARPATLIHLANAQAIPTPAAAGAGLLLLGGLVLRRRRMAAA